MGQRMIGLALLVTLVLSAVSVDGATAGSSGAAPKVGALVLHFQDDGSSAGKASLRLRGPDARQQLLATARFSDGALRDFTRQVSYSVTPANVVKISKAGLVTPLGNGMATLTAKDTSGVSTSLSVTVEKFKEEFKQEMPFRLYWQRL